MAVLKLVLVAAQSAPPPWERLRFAACDGCAAEAETVPLGEVWLCIACLRFLLWLDEDVRSECAEHYEGLTP